jgi:hypothetical protein
MGVVPQPNIAHLEPPGRTASRLGGSPLKRASNLTKPLAAAASVERDGMASDDHVASALNVFAKEVTRKSRADLGEGGLLSRDEADFRRRGLQGLAAQAQALATSPRTATYQAFDRILKQVEELGAQLESETIIRVASAFMQRPLVSFTRSQREPNGD